MNDREHRGQSSGTGGPAEAPLPSGYLPEPRPAAADAYWDRHTRRVMAALEPVLAAREEPTARAVEEELHSRSWMVELGDRWGATALLAAAAVVVLLAVGMVERAAEAPGLRADDAALTLIAGGGDPTLLWDRLGIPADPVLAWLTFDGVRP